MAWIYFQELVGSQSLSKDTSDQSPIVKSIDTVRASYCPECDQVTLSKLPSGTMCELSRANCYPKKSISFMEASPVRTSVLQEMEKAWKATEVACSYTSSDLRRKSSLLLSFWKMSPRLGQEDLTWSSGNFSRSGTMRDGRLFQPKRLVPRIGVKGGSYLPTPVASRSGYNKSKSKNAKVRPGLSMMARTGLWPTPCARDSRKVHISDLNRRTPSLVTISHGTGGDLNPAWVEWLMGYSIGWTNLGDWETQWFHSKQKQRLKG